MEELENPYRNLPLAIFIALPLTAVCYLLVNVSYFTVLTTQEIISSDAVAVSWANRVLGPASFLILIGVMISILGAANSSVFTAGRITSVAGRESHVPDIFSYIHLKQRTPIVPILSNGLISSLMIISGNTEILIDVISFTTSIFDCAAMVALLVMRFTRKDQHRPIKVPIIIPIIVMVGSACLFAVPMIFTPQIEYFYVVLFIFSGIVFYVPFVYYKKTLLGMREATLYLQKFLLVAQTAD